MKLPEDSIIAEEKIKNYLLSPRVRNDKSKWLERAGYSLANWYLLESDLRKQILQLQAAPTEKTKYGQMYEIQGKLKGPNGKLLSVTSIWMTEFSTGITKFITVFPNK